MGSFANGQKLTQSWNGTYVQSGADATVTNAGWSATIPANGGSVEFGFLASRSGTANDPPGSFRLNDSPCVSG
ncbi:cellulose binding domain-containing protein [Nonomuraea sp. NPDC005501]|uniref:cellulose binding domain-containing protein n=1 Tax=Nonomuraea sp. NPDC005501 TaxID=3156884 RepID=UPI0033BCC9D2